MVLPWKMLQCAQQKEIKSDSVDKIGLMKLIKIEKRETKSA